MMNKARQMTRHACVANSLSPDDAFAVLQMLAEDVTLAPHVALAITTYLGQQRGSKLEELEERAIVAEWLPKLKAGPYQSGALRWEDIEGEWDE